MKLLVYRDNQLISQLELEPGNSYLVGRKDSCHIILEKLPGISREHFEIKEDSSGIWSINVLSELLPIEVDGEEQKTFNLQGTGEFLLKPYRFTFEGGSINSQNAFNQMAENSIDSADSNFSNIEVFQEKDSLPEVNSDDDMNATDEKTAVHSFNGVPYIKIIGQNGKKSEYFRLEGHLWVIGGDESASVYIREASASQNHFEISKTDKGFFVLDSGTNQGTELNGQKLSPKKATRLLSGDILTVGNTSLQFELRDQAFKRKVSSIPLNMYKNPLVFFENDVAMVSLEEDNSPGQAEELNYDPTQSPEAKKKMIIRAAAVIMILIVAAVNFMPNSDSPKQKQTMGADPFSQLTPAEQKIVIQTHKLAKQLFLAKNYELSLVQLDKLHSIIPVYKDSKEIEEYCVNSRELKRQQALNEKQRREQEKVENEVRSYIAQCNQKYATSDDIDGVKACLSPATELDPNNPSISQLITDVTARQEEKRIREKIAAEQRDKIRRGKELFQRARQLHSKNNYLQAIEAYENHIHSGLPDPKRLIKKSKRHLATIERRIKNQKSRLIGQAQQSYGNTKLRDAIYLARKAQAVDPYDPKISSFLFKVEKELNNKMKNIYLDSVIEESFGNLEASRIKWEEIMKVDVNDGEYYRKAKRKLKQYGFKH